LPEPKRAKLGVISAGELKGLRAVLKQQRRWPDTER
jgi:hypothetical protein